MGSRREAFGKGYGPALGVRERVGDETVPQRRSPSGESQRVEAPPDVVENLADDRGLGDEPYDAHPLAAPAQEGVDLLRTLSSP